MLASALRPASRGVRENRYISEAMEVFLGDVHDATSAGG